MAEIREFLLPDLGEGLEDAEIVKWHVEPGEYVDLNQEICDVETEKALVAIPSPFAGKVIERFGDVGETVRVRTPLIRVEVEDAVAEAETGHAPAAEKGIDDPSMPGVLVGYGAGREGKARRRRRPPSGARPGPAAQGGQAMARGAGRPLAKPPVRKLAKDLDVDIATLAPGSGPNGTITREDVEAAAREGPAKRFAASQVSADADLRPGATIPMRGIRARIAEKMVASRTRIPEATTSITVDCTELRGLARRLTEAAAIENQDVKITPLILILKAACISLRRFPVVNARLNEQDARIELCRDVNLGVAADTPRGLMVPVVRHADSLSTLQLAGEVHRLVGAARDGLIQPGDLTGGTFTVNNFGSLGAEDGEPIINYPEAAILGVGAMVERPWVVDGELAVRHVAKLVMAFDHRILDGGDAARFLLYLGRLVEDPSAVLLHTR